MKNIFEINKEPGGAVKPRWPGLVGLLLIAASAWIAVDRQQPAGPYRDRNGHLRVSWYLRSGQWRADIRTLAAVVAYVMQPEDDDESQYVATATAQRGEPAGPPLISARRIQPDDPQLDLQANVINPAERVEVYQQAGTM